jgi:hypothetical protein
MTYNIHFRNLGSLNFAVLDARIINSGEYMAKDNFVSKKVMS